MVYFIFCRSPLTLLSPKLMARQVEAAPTRQEHTHPYRSPLRATSHKAVHKYSPLRRVRIASTNEQGRHSFLGSKSLHIPCALDNERSSLVHLFFNSALNISQISAIVCGLSRGFTYSPAN